MSNNYEQVIPAASDTSAFIQRVPGEDFQEHPVPAWALIGGRMEALVHVNETGELTPVSELRKTNNAVDVVQGSTSLTVQLQRQASETVTADELAETED